MTVAVTGEVGRIYAHEAGAYIRLKDVDPQPRSSYFSLELGHPNYNALYALALAAAVNGHQLRIRARDDITPDEFGIIVYMTVDY